MKPNASAKLDMLAKQQRGEFGNFLSIVEAADVKPKSWYTLRNKERDSPFFIPTVKGSDVRGQVQRLLSAGATQDSIYIQDIPHPDSLRLIQGEIARFPEYHLEYFRHPTMNLRDAMNFWMKDRVRGIMARESVLFYGGQQAWDDLEELLDRFPESTVEFTVFDRPVGAFNRQLIVWECRNY